MTDIKAAGDKTGVPYEIKMRIIPQRYGLNFLGQRLVHDEVGRVWVLGDNVEFTEAPSDQAKKRRRAAIGLLAEYAENACGCEVGDVWETLFDDEASDQDEKEVLRIAREATTKLLAEEGVTVDGDDD